MKLKKNILLYNSSEPLPEQGGMERVTDLLAKGLVSVGYNVILLCKYKNRLGKIYDSPTAIVYMADTENQKAFFIETIEKYNIDCVIDQAEGEIVGRYGIFRNRDELKSKVKLIAVQHSSARSILCNYHTAYDRVFNHTLIGMIKSLFYNKFYLNCKYLHSLYLVKCLYRDLNSNYDKIVVLSPAFIKDFCYFYCNANTNKLAAIPNFNTFDSCQSTIADKRVLFVGRLKNNVKGVDKLLRIWATVEPLSKDWRLDIVGDGDDRCALEEMAKILGLQRVSFHGFQDPSVFYKRSSIFCMTSIYEGFGMVLTEAMQHGIVPIAFNSYVSASDIIDNGINGFLVKPFDEVEYAQKLMALMTDKSKLNQMSQNAIEKASVFSKENIIEKWCNLLDAL